LLQSRRFDLLRFVQLYSFRVFQEWRVDAGDAEDV
jgi:hypothetical protein